MAGRGRPKLCIQQEELEFFLNMKFTRKEISDILQVSERTIGNYLREYGLKTEDRWHDINGEELDEIVEELTRQNPTWGERMLSGALEGMGLKIKREMIRESMHRVDQEGVQRRRRHALHRREYHVAGPNALWHIDGNHKLIRWRFVVHGGIDGFSRIPVFLDCHTDNRASSVLASFLRGVGTFGLPQRVRADHGGENVRVSEFMLRERGLGRGSFITGRSVHNQRIERLWRDVFQGCLLKYYNLFYEMENRGALNPLDDLDLYSLHYVFSPIINNSLQHFRTAYVHHKLRTATNRTPLQLWMTGAMDGFPIDFLGDVDANAYGIDPFHQDQNAMDEPDMVVVPATRLPFAPEEIQQFEHHFPLDIAALQEPAMQFEFFLAVQSYLSERWQVINERM